MLFTDTPDPATSNMRGPLQRILHHIAFAVDPDAELAALAARLNESVFELVCKPRDGIQIEVIAWCDDPDGNRTKISYPDVLTIPLRQEGRRNAPECHHSLPTLGRFVHALEISDFFSRPGFVDISDGAA